MPTANEAIRDALIRHQIGAIRVSAQDQRTGSSVNRHRTLTPPRRSINILNLFIFLST